jgi:PAS domain S-box-containing protein
MEHWLAATMSSIGDGVIATDRDFRVNFINPVAESLCAMPAAAALGRPIIEVFRLRGPRCTALDELIEHATHSGLAVQLDECELERADGTALAIDDTVAPIRDASGKVGGVVVVFRDARERQRHEQEMRNLNAELEDKVRRRTAQLQAANHELASFSYSIAHDLRAPLRAINGFASLVMTEHGASLGEEGHRLLDVVVTRAAQMSRMIDDYLRLSGLSHVQLLTRELDMTQCARDAWASVTAGLERVPELQLEELPRVRGDEGLIRQVWVNLLSNAAKFSREATQPRVRVSAEVEPAQVRYRVEDNGVGFDPAQASKLFRVFERLHTRHEFEGEGIGLCIVQRILHRHEGDVTIRGVPGGGATVEFTLPRAAESGEARG